MTNEDIFALGKVLMPGARNGECTGDHTVTEAFLSTWFYDQAERDAAMAFLMERGGYCDCEVGFNVVAAWDQLREEVTWRIDPDAARARGDYSHDDETPDLRALFVRVGVEGAERVEL